MIIKRDMLAYHAFFLNKLNLYIFYKSMYLYEVNIL